MRHRNGRFMNGRGRWETASAIREEESLAHPGREVLQAYSGAGYGRKTDTLPSKRRTKKGYLQVSVGGKPGPIGPKSDLHELLLFAIENAVRERRSAVITDCIGQEVFKVGRSKGRWFVRREHSTARGINVWSGATTTKLERDRIIIKDVTNPSLYWIVV